MSDSSTLVYGLGAAGFVRMRLPEIRRAIYNELTARTGIVYDETPDSFSGQFISIFAEREAAMWELAEKAYLAPYPATAQGIPLDLAVGFSGVRRLQPARSQAVAYLVGTPGTIVPTGTIVQATTGEDAADIPPRYLLQADVLLTKAAVVGAVINVPSTVASGTIYWVEVSGIRYSVTATNAQNSAQIAAALTLLMASFATVSGDVITIYQQTPFIINWSTTLNNQSITCVGTFLSESFGPIQSTERIISNIVTPVLGLKSAYNPYAATPGQNVETDSEIRNRYSLGVFRLGAGTLPSIRANVLQNVSGIKSLRVFENTTGSTDADGRPPHSIELIVEGGDNQAIFNEIFKKKAGGIQSYGNTSGQVRSPDGYMNPISFSRPELRWIWLRVSFGVNTEEDIAGDIAGQIVAAVLASGATMVPGQDVILQKLEAAPFAKTTGLARVNIIAAVTPANSQPPTNFSASTIPMNSRQKAVFDISRITVV